MAPLTPAAAPSGPYTVPPEPSRVPSVALALAVHAGLLLFLWAGISWQNTVPTETEAEIWDMKTESAAAPPEPREAPPPVRQPPPPPPKLVEKVIPKPVEPPPVEKPPVARPDIALEREKKLKEEKRKQERLLEEKQALEKARKELAEEKRLLELRKLDEQKKLDQKKLEQQKQDQQKQLAEKQAEKQADDKAEKLAQEKAAKDKKAAEEQKKLDKMRADEMRRITGAAGGAGEAEKSSAPRSDTGYIASITAKIKNAKGGYVNSEAYSGNPRAVFRIEQLPTGEIISVKLVKSSGVAAFDDAVEKSIIKSSPLPKKKDGTVERSLEIGFALKEMN
ncbi:cell envelope integrity protein TolA [Massilia sp. CCM 8733]|uniref:Cell envelope integrity protein TolA n=1 Tax=Massilia mucilaginosa TaxID=2609282 RepID=A0ABX0NQS7_9BURK|nr:cell envelope integrity protein TolA [Massilia mucilaginosa]NHZ89198.1 cell envelope integrity protein TolA [Massilia mucilaginosa]